MFKKFLLIVCSVFIYMMIFEGCVYHKADVEYPSSNTCDTTGIRYNTEIKAILDEHCKPCHSGSSPISGFDLYDYKIISGLALDGQFTYGTLLSAVLHKGGAPAMPQDLPMIDSCEINKIAAWVHAGAPDN